jgi:putative ABC transport system permease protein
LLAVLAGVFAGLAVLLAWIGLYAVMSYITSGRLREIGIRMALGASPLAILRLITTQSALVIASGIACGAVASWLGARQVRSLLFDLDPADAETMFLAVGVVLVATALAAVLPARRASRVNPAITLR